MGFNHDLAIIGSGGAAFAAAIAARRRDLSVVMIEAGAVGGTCVNTGCVPSKALLAAAEARHVALEQRFPGIRTSAEAVDMAGLIAGKRGLVEQLRADKYVDLAAAYGWQILAGKARFIDGPALQVALNTGGVERIQAAQYLIATGSAPWAPPIQGLAAVGHLTSTTAMNLDAVPESLLVVGGNYIGLEQGQLFARLGTRVTVIEAMDRLAPAEEPEVSEAIAGVFADEGISVHTSATLTAVHREGGDEIIATLRDAHGGERTLSATHLLIAAGRRPITDGLDLDTVGVKVGDHGEVIVDEQLRTDNPRIWAAGDVTGHPQFVYVAAAHGSVIVDNAFADTGRTLHYEHLPRVTFTSPSIAAVGMSEEQALAAGIHCDCRVLPLHYVPRALVNRDTRGLVKIVADAQTGRILGLSAVAANAGDLAATGVYILEAGMTVEQVANMWCPYLTMTEAIKLAAQSFTTDITKLSCCAA